MLASAFTAGTSCFRIDAMLMLHPAVARFRTEVDAMMRRLFTPSPHIPRGRDRCVICD
jgi:hypothetical protein